LRCVPRNRKHHPDCCAVCSTRGGWRVSHQQCDHGRTSGRAVDPCMYACTCIRNRTRLPTSVVPPGLDGHSYSGHTCGDRRQWTQHPGRTATWRLTYCVREEAAACWRPAPDRRAAVLDPTMWTAARTAAERPLLAFALCFWSAHWPLWTGRCVRSEDPQDSGSAARPFSMLFP
jgi:hypothetical protein